MLSMSVALLLVDVPSQIWLVH